MWKLEGFIQQIFNGLYYPHSSSLTEFSSSSVAVLGALRFTMSKSYQRKWRDHEESIHLNLYNLSWDLRRFFPQNPQQSKTYLDFENQGGATWNRTPSCSKENLLISFSLSLFRNVGESMS